MSTVLSHVGVCVSDVEASTRFYCEALGFDAAEAFDVGDEFGPLMELDGVQLHSQFLRRDGQAIELLSFATPEPGGTKERRPMTQFGLTHLCFRVDDATELFDLAARAGGAAHPATATTLEATGVTVVYLTDPDGVRIECMAGSPDLAQFPAPG